MSHKHFKNSPKPTPFVNYSNFSNISKHEGVSDERVGLTKTQQLITLLQPLNFTIVASSSANQIQSNFKSSSTSNFSDTPLCFSTYTHKTLQLGDTPWIIDTRVTYSMVCCISFLTTITTHISFSVKLHNGNQVHVTHTGNVQLIQSISLTDVLCFPSFYFNILLAKKLLPHSLAAWCSSLITILSKTFQLGQRLGRVK